MRRELEDLKQEHAGVLDQLGLVSAQLRASETASVDAWRSAYQEISAAETHARQEDAAVAVARAAAEGEARAVRAAGETIASLTRERDAAVREAEVLRARQRAHAVETTALGRELATLDTGMALLQVHFSSADEELEASLVARTAAVSEGETEHRHAEAAQMEAAHLWIAVEAQRTALDELRSHVSRMQADADASEAHFLEVIRQLQASGASQRAVQDERLRAWEELSRRLHESAWISAPMLSGDSSEAYSRMRGEPRSLHAAYGGGVPLHGQAAIELIRARRSLEEVSTLVSELVAAEQRLVEQQQRLFADAEERIKSRDAITEQSLAARLEAANAQLDASQAFGKDFEARIAAAGRQAYGEALEATEAELNLTRERLRKARQASFAAASALPSGTLTIHRA